MKASRRVAAVVAGGLGLVPVLLLSQAVYAWADAPSKAGWWNALSGGGAALPVPTTGTDDLHVSQGPNAPAAYAALGFDLLGQAVSGATLELKIVANSAVGTVDLMACPTKDNAWKTGGDQPMDAAPAYNCATGIQGAVADDGSGVTFFLDTHQLVGADYSIAIVPSPDAVPFSVDLAKPDASSLNVQVDAAPEQPAPVVAPAAPGPPAAGMTGTAPLGPVTAPVAPVAPLQAPAVAAPVPAPQAAAAPIPITRAASQQTPPVSNRERYIAGSMLALIAGLLVWSFQQPAPTPRLIGGMARKEAPLLPPVDVRPRGIGRFASMRTTPARPLV
jgi:hypothetical protein